MRLPTLPNFVFTSLLLLQPVSSNLSKTDVDRDCHGYSVSDITEDESRIEAKLKLRGHGCGIYGSDVPDLRLIVEHQTESRLHVLIQDLDGNRYQVPEEVIPRPDPTPSPSASRRLGFNYTQNPFSFQVFRKDTQEALFDTSGSALVFERQFLRLRTRLPPNPNLYGLGEHTDPFRLYTEDYTRTFWARDSGGVPERQNLYGNHPVYFEHRGPAGGTHGVFLRNSNGMDVHLGRDDRGSNYLEYNAIGGVFDFYFLAGPTPVEVSRQYAAAVGLPAMIPYWSLGFQNCRYGYRDWFEVAEVVHNYSAAGIPLETMWTDIDYMDRRRVFSLDPERYPFEYMQSLVQWLHGRQQKYILMVDPAVAAADYPAYTSGQELDAFVKNEKGDGFFNGVVWPGVTVYPDWFHPQAQNYWTQQIQDTFNPETGVDIDAIWIDMNEPANFCQFPCTDPSGEAERLGNPPKPPPVREPPRTIPGFPYPSPSGAVESSKLLQGDSMQSVRLELRDVAADIDPSPNVTVDHEGDDLLHPPYSIHNFAGDGSLSDMTLRTDVRHANGQWEYDVHNLYGTMMSLRTRSAMLARRAGLRTFVVTRSTFAGAGRYVQKWLGDNRSEWNQYYRSIAGILNMNAVFQVPMVGADVCGFDGDTTENLCARWATLGAFSPFYRNHNGLDSIPQEFYRWPLVISAAKYAIDIRYRLLDYFYTALHRQSTDGTPSLNPMWYLYPDDETTFGIDLQYLWGDCILVSPVVDQDATSVRIYLPDDLFYSWDTQQAVRGNASWVTLDDVPMDRIPIHVRGGCVVPLRTESANTTTELRKKPFELLVAPGLRDGKAEGSLILDDGVSLEGGENKSEVHFEYDGKKVSYRTVVGDVVAETLVTKVTILG